MNRSSSALPLTAAELDAIAGAARGETIADTARRRVVSPLTIKSQRRSALRELGVRSTAQAVAVLKDAGAL